jgi:hypothetical protein
MIFIAQECTFNDSIETSFFAGYYYVIEIFVLLPSFWSGFDLTISVKHCQ